MINTYVRNQDPHGVTGPLVRSGKACTLNVAINRAKRAVARGAVEVELRELDNGKEVFVGIITPKKILMLP